MSAVSKQERELHFIREFLEQGLSLSLACVSPQKPPQPDALITTTAGDLLEIEHTDYQIDEPADGNSPARRLANIWERVISRLADILTVKELLAEASVTLQDPETLAMKLAEPLADELVRFAEDHRPQSGRQVFNAFAGYPVLTQHVRSITVWRTTYRGFYWRCTDEQVGNIGIVPRVLAQVIRAKSGKTYKWTEGAEKCLLIVASADSIASHGGPNVDPSIWQDVELQTECSVAPFDRIFFWESVRKWHQQIK